MKGIFLCNESWKSLKDVYSPETIARLSGEFSLPDKVFCSDDLATGDFADVDYIFSTWGMPSLSGEQIDKYLPNLKAVFYAAGTVQAFARPFLERGIHVFSAWKANAVPVVEYTVAQIILANKGFFGISRIPASDRSAQSEYFKHFPGNFGAKVGIIGDGAIGSEVIRRLLAHRLTVCVYSITMSQEVARKLGVQLVSLEEMFRSCSVISNHLANNEQTKGMISRSLISSLQPYSTFINTGRGAQVDEAALIDKLTQDPTVTALLDVTWPEPPVSGSALYSLKNCFLTPHIAGSAADETKRMAEYMLSEALRFTAGEPTRYEVSMEMLATMA